MKLEDENACQCWNDGQYGRVHREDCPIHGPGGKARHYPGSLQADNNRIIQLEATVEDLSSRLRTLAQAAVEDEREIERYRNTVAQAAAWLDGPERAWVLSNAGLAEAEAADLLEDA